MKTTLLLAVLCTGCATLYPKDQGCTQVVPADPGFSGYKVMECPHPFAVANGHPKGCQWATFEQSQGHGPALPCGWVRSYTDRAARTVYYWELYPETLQHELGHVRGSLPEDE